MLSLILSRYWPRSEPFDTAFLVSNLFVSFKNNLLPSADLTWHAFLYHFLRWRNSINRSGEHLGVAEVGRRESRPPSIGISSRVRARDVRERIAIDAKHIFLGWNQPEMRWSDERRLSQMRQMIAAYKTPSDRVSFILFPFWNSWYKRQPEATKKYYRKHYLRFFCNYFFLYYSSL